MSLASSGCLCLHLGSSPDRLPLPPLPILCLPGEASGPWALRTQTGHEAGTPLGRAPCVQGPGSPQAGLGSPRPQGRLLLDAGPPTSPCGAAGLRSSLVVGKPQIPGGGLRWGPWPDSPHPEPPVSTKHALGCLRWAGVLGQKPSECGWRSSPRCPRPGCSISPWTTQVGVGWLHPTVRT